MQCKMIAQVIVDNIDESDLSNSLHNDPAWRHVVTYHNRQEIFEKVLLTDSDINVDISNNHDAFSKLKGNVIVYKKVKTFGDYIRQLPNSMLAIWITRIAKLGRENKYDPNKIVSVLNSEISEYE